MKTIICILVMSCVICSCGGDDGIENEIPPIVENKTPSIPSQIYPENNDLCIDNEVNFQWNPSTDEDGNPISYIVDVAKTASFSPLEYSKTSSSTAVTISLEKGMVYFWRVKAVDSKNAESNYSTTNQFYAEGEGIVNHLPFSPDISSPELNSIISSDSTTLEWNSTDVDADDNLVYDVYFDSVEPPVTKISENQSANSLVVSLTGATTFYWKIVVKDGQGGQTIGQTWHFSTD